MSDSGTPPGEGPDNAAADAARSAAIAAITGHTFRDHAVLVQALTHASRCGAQSSAGQRLAAANERLEFLGDALLGAALCLLLYRRHGEASEGQLSRMKSQLASRQCLARIGDRCDLWAHALVGGQLTGTWPDSVKANLMESVLAAVFSDGGWDALLATVERLYTDELDTALAIDADVKTRLQSWCLEHHGVLPVYSSQRSGGSDHDPQFSATVDIADHQATGSGGSRRRAEAAAAAALLDLIAALAISAAPVADQPGAQ